MTDSMSYINKSANKVAARKLQVKRQKRMICIASILLVFGIMVFGTMKANAKENKDVKRYMRSYTVAYQDTLYDIALQNMDELHYDSVSDYIEDIACINHLDPDHISAGLVIMLPYYSASL